MSETISAAEQMLKTATEVVKQRRSTYGPPTSHFETTARLVSAALRHKLREDITASDWAIVMILDKIARHQGPNKTSDTPVDLAGYAACLAECEAQP